jgi:transposase
VRIVGLDIHRVFAEAVMLDEGKVVRLGRIGMTREHLEAFARTLTHDDHVVVEATGNAAAVAEVLAPHVGRVAIANPRQVRLIAEARIKTDVIDATVLARLYASGFLPEVWVPDQRTLALRRQVTRRNQVVRQRARLKTIIQSILHAHLVPPCPHADLLGPRGRAWLLAQPLLPPDEADAVARHLREHDRLSEDLRVVERELAREALADADTKRLMTIPGIDMVVAVGLLAAIGPVTRFESPDKLVSYLGLNPTVHQSGEGRPRHGRISKQGRTHARTRCAVRVHCGRSTSGSPGAAATTSPPSPWPGSSRSSSGICSAAAKTTPGCARRCTRGSSGTWNSARGSRPAVASAARPTPTT